MDSLLVLIEVVLVFGFVLGLAFWELRRVRRSQRADGVLDRPREGAPPPSGEAGERGADR